MAPVRKNPGRSRHCRRRKCADARINRKKRRSRQKPQHRQMRGRIVTKPSPNPSKRRRPQDQRSNNANTVRVVYRGSIGRHLTQPTVTAASRGHHDSLRVLRSARDLAWSFAEVLLRAKRYSLTRSPTRISPPVKICARNPPRCRKLLITGSPVSLCK